MNAVYHLRDRGDAVADGYRAALVRDEVNAAKSAGHTRIDPTILTGASSPRSHTLYTVAVDTPSRSATSRTRSRRSLPPSSAATSATVGTIRAISAFAS